jgi:hypothetical protein
LTRAAPHKAHEVREALEVREERRTA